MKLTKRVKFFIILCVSVLVIFIVNLALQPISAYIRIDCYSNCATEEVRIISDEINGKMTYGYYENSNKYNMQDPSMNICYFLIEYTDTRLSLWLGNVEKKFRSKLDQKHPNVIAVISGGIIKNGFLFDLEDPYGDTDPPWRWGVK